MIRRLAIIELWIAILVVAAAVAFGISDRWGRFTALIFGVPLLLWVYLTWKKMRSEAEAEYSFPFVLRVFVACLATSFFIIAGIRGYLDPRAPDWGLLIGLIWMIAPISLFIRKTLEIRRDLYQK